MLKMFDDIFNIFTKIQTPYLITLVGPPLCGKSTFIKFFKAHCVSKEHQSFYVISRDEILFGHARAAADPWDSSTTRESQFINLIIKRFPEFKIKNLSPLLDSMRLIKSPEEIKVIRKATEIAGLAIIEAMKSTKPGIYEYQLDAAAKYIFYLEYI